MRKRKILSCLLVFSLSAGLLSACGSSKNATSEATTESVAVERTGPDAKWLNSNIVDYITEDTPANIKDDFALAVNKDYTVNTKIEAGRVRASTLNSVNDKVQVQLIDLFESTLEGHDSDLVKTAAETYGQWADRDKQGVEPIMSYVNDINSLESLEDINTFISDPNRNYEAFGMPMFSVEPSYDNPEDYSVFLYWVEMQSNYKDYYGEDSDIGQRELNYHKLADIYMLKRVGYSEEEAENIYQEALSFEKKMAENLYTYDEMNLADFASRTNNSYNEKELEELCKNYPIDQFLSGWGFDGSNEYNAYAPDFLAAMSELWTEENVPEIKSYLLNMFLHANIKNIDSEAYDYYIEITTDYNGTDASMTDEEKTFDYVKNSMEHVLDNVYIETYGDKEIKEDILGMCNDVISYYRTMLETQDWLSEETRQEAIKKLDNLVVFSCYPDELYDTDMYNISAGSNVVEMTNQLKNALAEENRRKVNTKVDRNKWTGYPSYTVNASYNPQTNSITIYNGILGDGVYQKDWSYEQRLAAIGVIIGHEISHAFDSEGSQFDEVGAMRNWWTEEDSKEYENRVSKLIAYYDAMTPDVVNQPYSGEQVKGEALADMTGMKAILGILEKEKNVDYEVFFKQYANLWATVTTKEMETYYFFQSDVHPLAYLRINCTVQQFDEFLDTFDVQEGDGMYLAPEDRVLVW